MVWVNILRQVVGNMVGYSKVWLDYCGSNQNENKTVSQKNDSSPLFF